VDTLDQAIELVNRNPYANGTAIFTESGGAARRFENEIQVGMVGVNVPIPVPVAYFSFGGWKNSLFGDLHVHGTESVKFYTRTKVVTTRWPHQDTPAPGFHMPTLVVYVLGVLGIAYHLANGFWSFMTMGWGGTVSKSGIRWMERVSILVFVVLLVIGAAAIYGLYRGGAAYGPG